MPDIQELLIIVAVAIVSAALGFGGGYLARGDCAAAVRATEATATAKAEVKAAHIETKTEVKNERRKATFHAIDADLSALPPVEPVPAGCPLLELSDDELRLWNAGNQNEHEPVQQPGVDGAGARAAEPRAADGESSGS